MNLKRIGATLLATLVIGALTAGSALGAATTVPATWRTGTSGTVLSGSLAITTLGNLSLRTEVGATALTLESQGGIECFACRIFNEGGGARGEGELRLKNVRVITPSTCAVEGGEIRTKSVRFDATYMIGTWNYIEFEPFVGSTLATVKLVKGTGACALGGSYLLSGKVFARSSNATGVYATAQTIQFSGAENSIAGGGLNFGAKPAELNGLVSLEAWGATFGTHE